MAMQSGFIKRIRDIMRMDAGINGDAQRIEQMVWMLFLKVYDAKEDDWELNEDNYESIIPENLRWRNWAKADSNGHAMTGDKLLNFVNNTLGVIFSGTYVPGGVLSNFGSDISGIWNANFDGTDTKSKILSGMAGVLNVGLNIAGNLAAIYNLGFGTVKNGAEKAAITEFSATDLL